MATVTRLRPKRTPDLAAAAGQFLAERDLAPSTRAVYRDTLAELELELGAVPLAEITTDDITRHLDRRYGHSAPATFNRHRATIGSLFAFAQRRQWVDTNPVDAVERRNERPTKGQVERRRAVPYDELADLWNRSDIPVRERCLWRMLYETGARANEILNLNIEDLDLDERSALVDGKGHGAESVYWATGTARLLPKLIDRRTHGPLFLADRLPNRPTAKGDLDPTTGKARLSYRRSAELFTDYSGGLTLHQLRHSAITDWAEQGVPVTMLKAKSRHRSLRSLERYARPSEASVAKLTADLDPEARRKRRSR